MRELGVTLFSWIECIACHLPLLACVSWQLLLQALCSTSNSAAHVVGFVRFVCPEPQGGFEDVIRRPVTYHIYKEMHSYIASRDF
jgi:hypothetical protein